MKSKQGHEQEKIPRKRNKQTNVLHGVGRRRGSTEEHTAKAKPVTRAREKKKERHEQAEKRKGRQKWRRITSAQQRRATTSKEVGGVGRKNGEKEEEGGGRQLLCFLLPLLWAKEPGGLDVGLQLNCLHSLTT